MVRPAQPDPSRRSIFVFRLIGAALASGALAFTVPAAAEPTTGTDSVTPRQVALRYSDPAGCPGQAQFIDAVNARVRRAIEWDPTATAIQMAVTIESSAERATGKLEVVERGTEPTRREFTASTCEEVSSALALVAALALDPNARTEPLPRAPAASEREFPAAPTPAAPEATREETPPPASPAAPAPSTPPARPRDPSHYLAWLGPSASVAGGYAPEPLISLGLALGARRVRPGLSPGLQLTALWGKTGTTGPSAASGVFAWAVGRLEACPLQLRLSARVTLEPCVAAEAGRLSARGADQQIDEPVTAERWWFAPGATLAAHVSLGNFFLRFGALGLIPVTRDEFVFFGPLRSVHQASPVVYGANLGLGFQFGT
jgi:hypothetical protein